MLQVYQRRALIPSLLLNLWFIFMIFCELIHSPKLSELFLKVPIIKKIRMFYTKIFLISSAKQLNKELDYKNAFKIQKIFNWTIFGIVSIRLHRNCVKSVKIRGFPGPNVGKYGPEKTRYLDTFHTGLIIRILAFYSLYLSIHISIFWWL